MSQPAAPWGHGTPLGKRNILIFPGSPSLLWLDDTGKHWGVAGTLVGRQQPGAQGKNGFNKWIHQHLQNHQSIKN